MSDLAGLIAVFAGPSLPPGARPEDQRLVWLAPAMAGDAYAIETRKPTVMVLIDGFFDQRPAIRHKELMELMAGGTPVIGGASMGALRAAELADHGMIGVGAIFAAYRSGLLIADDEVAVLHGPEDLGWAALTEPLVNVRATLVVAAREGVVDIGVARRLREAARAIFYQRRTWAGLIEAAEEREPADASALRIFEAWLPAGRVNLKRLDALACIHLALNLNPNAFKPPPPPPMTIYSRTLRDQVESGAIDD